METFDAIRTLLAVREYRPEPVPEEVLRRVLEAARLTGSARNRQPWRLVAVTDAAALRRLGEIASRGPYIAGAPLCVAVAIPEGAVNATDGARAIQDMMLTAWSAGVGSNWVSALPEEQAALRELLGLPAELRVLALVPFGYPARPAGWGRKDRKPLGEIAFRDRYGQPFA